MELTQKQNNSCSKLPDDCLREIFSWIDDKDILSKIALLNRYIRSILRPQGNRLLTLDLE